MIPVRMREQDEVAGDLVRCNTRRRISRQKRIHEYPMRPVIEQKSRMTIVAEFYHCDHSPVSQFVCYVSLYDMYR